jgi:3-keto-5-aminohexanoate cleavage enzyme
MKLIIDFTPTGMIPTKEMTPHVPVSPGEIINQVLEAYDLGITKVHLHARDSSGKPTYKVEVYDEIINGIQKYSDVVICLSTSGREFRTFLQRSECLYLSPEMASLTLSSLNFNKQESVNAPEMIQALAKKMLEKGIKPELEVFDTGMINYAKYLISKELLKPPFYFNLLLGNIACAQADALYLGLMIKELPENSLWSVAGIGDAQLPMNSAGIALGGGVRVGLEDNIWYDRERTKLASNLELLHRIHRIAEANEREVMKPSEFREWLKG